MQIDLTFRPRGWQAKAKPSVQEEERFGTDALDLGAQKINSKGDGGIRCIDGGATDISSGLEMGYGCQNGDTSVTSGWKHSGF